MRKPRKKAEISRRISESDRLRISDVSVFTMENGCSLFVHENRFAPTVSIQFWVKAGSIYEGEYQGCGLSHFLEHMVFQGTTEYPGSKSSDVIHEAGGDINAYTSYSNTVYHIDISSAMSSLGIRVLSQIVRSPRFPARRFAEEKKVILHERDMMMDNPNDVVSERLWRNLFTAHPARHPIIGYRDKIAEVDRKMMVDYFGCRYCPGRTFIVVCGDVRAESVYREVASCLEDWGSGNLAEFPILPEPEPSCLREFDFSFHDPLGRISIGFPTPGATDSDVPVLDVLAGILESGGSSRLVRQLRNRDKLATCIDSFNFNALAGGIFGVGAICNVENVSRLQDGIFREFDRVSRDGVGEEEIHRVVLQQETNYFRGMRSNRTIAGILGNAILSHGTPAYVEKYLDDLKRVRPEDIVRVCRRFLDPDRACVVRQCPATGGRRPTRRLRTRDGDEESACRVSREGVRVVELCRAGLPLVDLCLVLPGGSILEDAGNAGISHLAASLLLCGTREYAEEDLADRLDNLAVDFSIGAGNNTLVLRLNVHLDHLDSAFDLLESVVARPAFPSDAFERERENKLNNLKSRLMSPYSLAEDTLARTLFGSHPYGLPTVGIEEAVRNLTAKKMARFYRGRCLNSSRAVFGISGPFRRGECDARIDALLRAVPWSGKDPVAAVLPPIFGRTPRRARIALPREQAVVMIGLPACDMTSPDSLALDVCQISMNSLSSPLFKGIRDRAGLAYYVGVYSSRGLHRGFLSFYAGTESASADRVLCMLDRERLALGKKGLTESDFHAAKACIENELCEQRLTTRSLIFNSVLAEFYGNGHLEPWRLRERFRSLELAEANRVVREYMNEPGTVSIVVGPES